MAFGNLGDELMARYFLSQIREAFPETGLLLLTGTPGHSRSSGKNGSPRWNLPHLAKLLQPGDLLVGGGGSIFQDATSKRSLLYYLSLLSLADRRKARVMLFGQKVLVLCRLRARGPPGGLCGRSGRSLAVTRFPPGY